MPGGQAFITETRTAAQAAGIRFIDVHDADQGITHVIGPELGVVLPGVTLVAPTATPARKARWAPSHGHRLV
jgi:3-isopropylmalate/(R)-2-methylmalate dehydratase large subunit